jgi:hypothetical protein
MVKLDAAVCFGAFGKIFKVMKNKRNKSVEDHNNNG